MPIEAGDIKNGLTLLIEGQIYQVLEFMHVKPGKGAAILKTKLKNLKTGTVVERNFNPNMKFEQAMIDKRQVQYSYAGDGTYYFMDNETYEMYELSAEALGFATNFLKDGLELMLKFFDGEVLSVDLPDKIELTVTDTTDAVAGNTSTTATKDATVETGLLVKVPLFIKLNDVIIVSTIDGKYVGRA